MLSPFGGNVADNIESGRACGLVLTISESSVALSYPTKPLSVYAEAPILSKRGRKLVSIARRLAN
jgi:hypothetical protein